jgi:D-amino peptidase
MKFAVAVDCEGPACVVGRPGGTLNDSANYEFAKLQATREADAAARGLYDAGATQVIVYDYHGGGVNLHYDLLDSRVDIGLGSGARMRFPGLDSTFDGLLLVGYHAMDNTIDGVIAHTYSSATYQWMKVDGQEVGEIAVDAALAGGRGVPLLFVASDDKAVAEARQFFPGIETVTTKTGYGWNTAVSMHPARAVEAIYAGARRVGERVKAGERTKPFTFPTPVTVELRYKRIEPAQGMTHRSNGWERIDAYTVRKQFERIDDFF